jgi:hypothetical protein
MKIIFEIEDQVLTELNSKKELSKNVIENAIRIGAEHLLSTFDLSIIGNDIFFVDSGVLKIVGTYKAE